MSWARFDDDVLDHPKLTMVSDLAAHLWWKSIVWSRKQKTNGVVPRHVIATLVRAKKPEALAKELVDAIPPGKSAGLFEAIDGGWKVHDFEHFGPPQRDELSETRAEAGRRGAAKRWQTDGKPDGKREVGDSKLPSACHAVPMANDSSRAGAPAHALPGAPAFPSRPVPSRPDPEEEREAGQPSAAPTRRPQLAADPPAESEWGDAGERHAPTQADLIAEPSEPGEAQMLVGLAANADLLEKIPLQALARRMAFRAKRLPESVDRTALAFDCCAYARGWAGQANKKTTAKQRAACVERKLGWILDDPKSSANQTAGIDASSEVAEMERTERETTARRGSESSASELFGDLAKGAA